MHFDDNEKFWEEYSQKDYIDIFYIRTKVWKGILKSRPPTGVRKQVLEEKNLFPQNKNMLYFNIPFCASRCKYCLYYTEKYNAGKVDEYLSALEREAAMISNSNYAQSTEFECVYWGGGTPSLLNEKQIDKIGELLFKNFHFTNNLEITFEANPSSLTDAKIAALKRNRFDRISLGIQSFNDRYLSSMDCKHNAAMAKKMIKKLLELGFRLNIDLIFGLDGQTEEELNYDLNQIRDLKDLQQISYFPLRLVSKTLLYDELLKSKRLDFNSHQKRLLDYNAKINHFLIETDYIPEEEPVHYYKKRSQPHRYQSLDGRIIGIGAGAGTLIDQVESGNLFDVDDYIRNINSGKEALFADSRLTERQTHERYVLYRLLYMNRSLDNVKEAITEKFHQYFNAPINNIFEKVTDNLRRKKLIENNIDKVILTEKFNTILKNFRFGTPSII